jgi:hypothetical protein
MTEFIPYAEALALKELGFDEPCFGWFRSTLIPSNFTEYILETEFGMNESPSDWVNTNFLDKACSAPLYQQAFRFFREKYGLYYLIKVFKDDNEELIFDYVILEDSPETESYDDEPYTTYEEAELACLIKLIEIVKKK